MILISVYVGGVSTARSPGLISVPYSETLSLTLTALLLMSVPDAFVVAIGHPQSRRSQLILSAVVMILSVCVCLFRGGRIGMPIRP